MMGGLGQLRVAAWSSLRWHFVCLPLLIESIPSAATEGCHLCETKGKLGRPWLRLRDKGGGWCRWNVKQRPPPPPPLSLLPHAHGLVALGVAGAGAAEWHHLYIMWLWDCRGATSFIKGLCWPSHHGNKTILLYLSNAVLRASQQGQGTDVGAGRWRLHIHTVSVHIILPMSMRTKADSEEPECHRCEQGRQISKRALHWGGAVVTVRSRIDLHIGNCVQRCDSVFTPWSQHTAVS